MKMYLFLGYYYFYSIKEILNNKKIRVSRYLSSVTTNLSKLSYCMVKDVNFSLKQHLPT